MASPREISSLKYTTLKYGEHSLQRVGVWHNAHVSDDGPPSSSACWIVFIHGGAWRDPRNTLDDFIPCIKRMLSSAARLPESSSWIQGFASIDYRLSPHPDMPQDPATTPAAEMRDAKHPDHVDDVRSALDLLDSRYKIAGKYVLIGHSAGATMAYQLFMSESGDAAPVPTPSAIIGVSGIYDLAGLCARREGYDGFIAGAFGTEKSSWDAASPAKFAGSYAGTLLLANKTSHLSILAASTEDTLIDMPEMDAMAAKLAHDGVDVVTVRDLTGEHDWIWQDGSQIADLAIRALLARSQRA